MGNGRKWLALVLTKGAARKAIPDFIALQYVLEFPGFVVHAVLPCAAGFAAVLAVLIEGRLAGRKAECLTN